MNIKTILTQKVSIAVKELYGVEIPENLVQFQPTRKEFAGDLTIVVFPFLKLSKKTPEKTGEDIGNYLINNVSAVTKFNVIKGFLNIEISAEYWISVLNEIYNTEKYGYKNICDSSDLVVIEYSSPNTNKPLHLGHIRNNLLGFSLANILLASGKKVIKVNLINDRGIHICKSMLAYELFGEGKTPQTENQKGDHFVGDFYVLFEKEYRKQVADLIATGKTKEEAEKVAELLCSAQEMLRKWEAGDTKVKNLWQKMNNWVYEGFHKTYQRLGVNFDKFYYESQTYMLGKDEVLKGLDSGVLEKEADGSVWADLTADKLDRKILLRGDGTSVYMTQDIGTAITRYEELKFNKHIYVVGNEQNYHFKVLALILKKLGYKWADALLHFSYGMVELPQGKMKSREGTVVDADDLMDAMLETAEKMANEHGKLDGMEKHEIENTLNAISLGALKYFILKVDPKKSMMFNPEESIDFNGNTGPFVQYAYTRTRSILRKADEKGFDFRNNKVTSLEITTKEIELIKNIHRFEDTLFDAAENLSPAIIANYAYDLAKEFNQFYHELPILKEENEEIRNFRIRLAETVGKIIKQSLELLGINVPERM